MTYQVNYIIENPDIPVQKEAARYHPQMMQYGYNTMPDGEEINDMSKPLDQPRSFRRISSKTETGIQPLRPNPCYFITVSLRFMLLPFHQESEEFCASEKKVCEVAVDEYVINEVCFLFGCSMTAFR